MVMNIHQYDNINRCYVHSHRHQPNNNALFHFTLNGEREGGGRSMGEQGGGREEGGGKGGGVQHKVVQSHSINKPTVAGL